MIDWDKYLYYDDTSPSFLRWKIDRGRSRVVKAGDVAGALLKEGRWSFVLTVNGKKRRRYNHRVIFEMFNGELSEGAEVDHRDGNPLNNSIDNLRKVSTTINRRNTALSSRNTSGVVGVSYFETNGCMYWCSTWKDLSGNKIHRNFSVKKLGREKAFEMACKARLDAIELLNQQGAGYTERHGT